MHDSAGKEAFTCSGDRVSAGPAPPAGSNARRLAATAIPIAISVITVNAPLATDFSARSSVIRTMIPKNPAAANVNHIGKVGERQT